MAAGAVLGPAAAPAGDSRVGRGGSAARAAGIYPAVPLVCPQVPPSKGRGMPGLPVVFSYIIKWYFTYIYISSKLYLKYVIDIF